MIYTKICIECGKEFTCSSKRGRCYECNNIERKQRKLAQAMRIANRKSNKKSELAIVAAEAAQAGMSYGTYVAVTGR